MAVKQKILKRQKLRNAEYYDFQNVQDNLYANSSKNMVFKNLMQYVLLEENIKLAYRNIKKNDGSRTAGVDNKTIKNLAKLDVEKLTKIVRDKLIWYKPQAIRRVEIPKDNDPIKTRPLGIPTIMDRLIQQCFLQVLEPICEAKFHDRSNGFRPNRSQEHAIAQCYKFMAVSELHFVVDIDIRGFFDNVSHGKLLKQIWTMGIRDKKLLSIISAMLKAEVAGIGFPEKGTAQGGVISPLLSNIVLNELDWWVTSQWEDIPTRYQYGGRINENGTQSKGDKYRSLRKYTKLKECYIVRYADDFKIFCKKRSDANKMFEAVKLWLKDRLGLEINSEKSKIINLKRNYSEFLGLKLKVVKKGTKNKNPKKPKYIARSHVKDKVISKVKSKLDRLIHDIAFPSGKRTEYQAISRYNSAVIGVHNYYNMATLVSLDFNKLAFSVHKSLKARLKERVKSKNVMDKKKIPYTLPQYMKERYGESGQLKFVNKIPIAPIGFVQYNQPMFKKKSVNAYTPQGRAEIHKNLECVNMEILHHLMRNPDLKRTIEFNDNRLSLYCAQQGKCAITGKMLEIGDMYCHHKLPRQLGGKDNYQNLMIIIDDVHKLIHATQIDTIKKYMGKLLLNSEQKKKIDELRKLALSENCLSICQV